MKAIARTALVFLLAIAFLAAASPAVMQTLPGIPPHTNLVWIQGYVKYITVNNDEAVAAGVYVYAAYSNGTPIPPGEGIKPSNITLENGYYDLVVPKPEDNIVKVCVANGVYCIDVNVSNANMLNPAKANITVPRATLAMLTSIDSSRVLIVYGNGSKWGPLHWRAATVDMEAAARVAQALNNATIKPDGMLVSWDPIARSACWRKDASIVKEHDVVVTIGGVGVNVVTWMYGFKPRFHIEVGEDELPVLVLDDGRVVYNATIGRFVYVNASGVFNVTEIPLLQVGSDKYGKVGFGIVYVVRDLPNNKTIVVVEGLTRYGTLAAGEWLRANIMSGGLPEDKAVIVVSWYDENGDGIVDLSEIHVIASY